MKHNKSILSFIFVNLLIGSQAMGFQEAGCGAGDCRDCHSVNRDEVARLLKGKVSEVLDVKRSEVPGLWDVEAVSNGQKIPFYIDFSKSYLISGNVIRLNNGGNLTIENFVKMNKVDRSKISLKDALVLGNAAAEKKIIVFDDPECTYCGKLHAEMKKVIEQQPDIAFYIKMFPLAMHPTAKPKAQTIVCAKLNGENQKAVKLLEESLTGKSLPAPDCDTDIVDKNIALAKEFYIASTPTLIMPDGRVLPGFKEADQIIASLEEVKKKAEKEKAEKEEE
ncbi:MAG: DsbC family protein [Candidatus Electrothrix sp. ATG1]|nr:DsbC family protein [Candidatus Electrothrix sp. ATG1]